MWGKTKNILDFSVFRGILSMCHPLFHFSPLFTPKKKTFPNKTVISGNKTKDFTCHTNYF